MKPYAYKVTLDALTEWGRSNPGDLQKVSKYLKEVCEIRSKSDNEKVKMSDKYTTSVVTGLPDKYKRPNGSKDIEVFIVEGDSAAGGAENNRDRQHQGIMPVRGKMPNAFTTSTKEYFENKEVAGLFKIFGYNGYSRHFDPDKFKPSKVIIMTDADADGSHIRCLLFGMFLRYLPFVIEQGKLYSATPPLYGAKINGEKRFFADDEDYINYVQNIFCTENKISNLKGKPYIKNELTSILYKNFNYVKTLDKVANTYSINPLLLEFLLINKNLDYNKFKKTVENQYKFLKVTNENGTTMIRGLVDDKFQTIFFNERLINNCFDVFNYINKSDNYYMINGEIKSLYQLMTSFKSFEPKNLTRYKGLNLGRLFSDGQQKQLC